MKLKTDIPETTSKHYTQMIKSKTKCLLAIGLAAVLMTISTHECRAQLAGVRTNALGWAALSPNIGAEIAFAKKWSAGIDATCNPFTWPEGRSSKFWQVQPEVRFWPRHKFAGHVFGIHGQYGQYDWARTDIRYNGYYYGGGVSYGYALMLREQLNLEFYAGFGYNRMEHRNRYDRRDADICFGPGHYNWWGITQAGVRLTYFIRFKR